MILNKVSVLSITLISLFMAPIFANPFPETPQISDVQTQARLVIKEVVTLLSRIDQHLNYWKSKTFSEKRYPQAQYLYTALESLLEEYGNHLGILILESHRLEETRDAAHLTNILQTSYHVISHAQPVGLSDSQLYHYTAQNLHKIADDAHKTLATFSIPSELSEHWLRYALIGAGAAATAYAVIAHKDFIAQKAQETPTFLKNNLLIPCKDMVSWIFDNKPLANSNEHTLQEKASHQGVWEYLERYHENEFPVESFARKQALEERVTAILQGTDAQNTLLSDLNAHGPNTLWNLVTPSSLGGGYLGHLAMVMFMRHKCQFNTYVSEADNVRNAIKWLFGLTSLSLASVFGYFTFKSSQAAINNYRSYSVQEARQIIHTMYMLLNKYRCQEEASYTATGLIYFYAYRLSTLLHKLPTKDQASFKQDLAVISEPNRSLAEKRAAIKHWYRHYSFLETPQSAFLY
jgi:hypothetical protein